MDESRRHDINKLMRARNDSSLTSTERRRVENARHKIGEQIKNPELRAIRRRLVLATKQGDMSLVDRLQEKIRKMEGKESGL